MGQARPKQYLELLGHPMLYHSVSALLADDRIDTVFVVLAPADQEFRRYAWDQFGERVAPLYCGGATRHDSVLNGLVAASSTVEPDDWILVHDAARPCLGRRELQRMLDTLAADEVGGILGVPLADTLKRADAAGRIERTEAREHLWQAQTPQMFRHGLLIEALGRTAKLTDEAGAVEALGLKPKLVQGSQLEPEGDLHGGSSVGANHPHQPGDANMRIGQGFDVHALVPGRKLIIGGVHIPNERGLDGHSDADVLLHAVCDALLGAAAMGDIGGRFPDTDASYKNADSRVLLREVSAPGAGGRLPHRQPRRNDHRPGAENGAAHSPDGEQRRCGSRSVARPDQHQGHDHRGPGFHRSRRRHRRRSDRIAELGGLKRVAPTCSAYPRLEAIAIRPYGRRRLYCSRRRARCASVRAQKPLYLHSVPAGVAARITPALPEETSALTKRSSFSYEQLLACGRGEMFGAGNAQLPLPPMLMFDRIIYISEKGGAYGKGEIVAELDLRPDLWFFACHFQGDPVMPGCLGLDAMWQLIGFLSGLDGRQGARARARLRRGQVQRPGVAEREENHLPHQHEARDLAQAGDGYRRCRDGGRRARIYLAGAADLQRFGAPADSVSATDRGSSHRFIEG